MNYDTFWKCDLRRKDSRRTIKSRVAQSETARYAYGHLGYIRRLAEAENAEKTCQWLEGEPKDRNFCGADVQPGSSYCPEHHARCYIKHQV